ncbi:MAG: hypothetical protein V2I66_11775 [Halieaceae bacterium]|jgi:hypothetical protein|nr:hypothetical protein [Halieaceae bacterium]
MNITDWTRSLAGWYLATFILYVVVSYMFQGLLPTELLEFQRKEYEEVPSTFDSMMALVSLPVIVAHLVSAIGLWKNRHWAPRLFLLSTLGLLLLSPFLGPYIESGLSQTVGSISSLILGALLALLILPLEVREPESDATADDDSSEVP